MIVADLTADHIGQTVSFPTWSALGYCRRGELTFIAPTGQGTTTLVIGEHIHTSPDNARIDILDTVELRGL
ncbi:hypothetical protein CXR25_13960 [Brevibacterium aurantiacum]|uniref:hypothetical protein n=1 Tax=Brevibacterium aurantiacum TaxID=273384 RepID=UPI000F653C76|nr:hypothetical protein [Brevibacterium aurantiacum]AZL13801.1 hypothetical protein CXR25_13960 [Brevibacterium aurantiacum]